MEGIRLLDEALASGLRVEPILYAPERLSATASGRALRQRLERQPLAEQIDEHILAAISETVTSQGVVAGVEIPIVGSLPEGGHVLVLDGIADPGNAGTMLRTALAAGAVGVVATKATTDLWSPKAVRAGMGAHFHLPLAVDVVDWGVLGDRQVLLAVAEGGRRYWEVDWSQPAAIVIGSEAHGASSAAASLATEQVTIPMAVGAESLNAAAAAAVLLFASRQRV
ncbi:MAG TPA: RNA methyltransferase [Chloroflexota bacterium]|nr:RNA methyltransferase [Chloroflexota bacterium]